MILRFEPILKPTIWGGDKLLPYKHISPDRNCPNQIGESWEVSGLEGHSSVVCGGEFDGMTLAELVSKNPERILGTDVTGRYGNRFPLLLKFLDTSKELSIQVHPDDNLARRMHNSCGKEEMWLILDAEEGAFLRNGFRKKTTPEEYSRAIGSNSLCSLLHKYDVKAGDVFLIPPGSIHNIGPGTMLIELQQSADITYRIYDFDRRDKDGNLRQLHTELASEAINYDLQFPSVPQHVDLDSQSPVKIMQSEYFRMDMDYFPEPKEIDLRDKNHFVILTCIGGNGTVRENKQAVPLKRGETVLVCADTQSIEVVPEKDSAMRLLFSSI